MVRDEKIWIADDPAGEPVMMIPKMTNRHGLVAGATGTGKTVTLKVMAESFSEMGIPVFIADVKGDVASIMKPGELTDDMASRIERFSLAAHGFEFTGCPVALWDLYGKTGTQLRTTVSQLGPLLLSRILGLNSLQSDILSVVFKIADDNSLLLVDIKDLKAMLNYVDANSKDFAADYGKISSASIGVIIRALVALEAEGGNLFFGEPSLDIDDLFVQRGGRGVINVLDSSSLINKPRLYSTFLLWLICELFENLPEVGDKGKPKMIFFFDEAHLLFNDASKLLLEKIEQLVKLIRSKGVGIFFCTQNPRDIPDGVLSQLGNKVQHGLRAYTPADQQALRAAANSFRVNPEFKTADEISTLGTGEAVISFLGEDGAPEIVRKGFVLPPRCAFGAITDEERAFNLQYSELFAKYSESVDPESAYESLGSSGSASVPAQNGKTSENTDDGKKTAGTSKKGSSKTAKSVGSALGSSVGRQLGREAGKSFGSFGKNVLGSVGSALGRGLFSTLFRK